MTPDQYNAACHLFTVALERCRVALMHGDYKTAKIALDEAAAVEGLDTARTVAYFQELIDGEFTK